MILIKVTIYYAILDEHLYNIECHKQFEYLMKQFAEKENINENLKCNNQME